MQVLENLAATHRAVTGRQVAILTGVLVVVALINYQQFLLSNPHNCHQEKTRQCLNFSLVK